MEELPPERIPVDDHCQGFELTHPKSTRNKPAVWSAHWSRMTPEKFFQAADVIKDRGPIKPGFFAYIIAVSGDPLTL